MNHTLLTIFTPSYNRAYILENCYKSLIRQTNSDFIWLIVDDGSTDNTKELVESWIKEEKISIRYKWQENQGMHGAHNTAYNLIDTELCMCCDSDDYLADDAIEKVLNYWDKFGSNEYSGMIGLDAYPDGSLISQKLNMKETTTYDIRQNLRLNCDYKLVFRSELLKNDPIPLFSDEKYVPLDCKYYKIDLKYKMLVFNEVLCFVEYLPDGGTQNIIIQFRKNPKGFAYFRKEVLKMKGSFKVKFRNAVHYVSSSIISRNKRFLLESPAKSITLLALPFGLLLYLFIMNTKQKSVIKA
ncbi:glycosyltransferase family 2 protein [Paenibacillus sp. LHD-38]|uniref:glycosyltransferase family 2 protein n=1 Tax=Paenibacillus sp. LHD-38 TaxID=3072143 RepID=UPI00280F5C90|nr:glycosyltransferase family 2 protein [Paenibacillus sp. LHD-38]MDQ8738350.1 glycosyltransferase family 2 protein [Paenibacillus sp. LHD-38]